MAKLTIEIEENEFALYDYEVLVDGNGLIAEDGNFTTEEGALENARIRVEEYFAFRGLG